MRTVALIGGILMVALTGASYFDGAYARCAGGEQAVMGRCPNGYATSAPRTHGQKPPATQYNR
jgi:1,4-dihydroxy-2-naphthoyl-CoA synthase